MQVSNIIPAIVLTGLTLANKAFASDLKPTYEKPILPLDLTDPDLKQTPASTWLNPFVDQSEEVCSSDLTQTPNSEKNFLEPQSFDTKGPKTNNELTETKKLEQTESHTLNNKTNDKEGNPLNFKFAIWLALAGYVIYESTPNISRKLAKGFCEFKQELLDAEYTAISKLKELTNSSCDRLSAKALAREVEEIIESFPEIQNRYLSTQATKFLASLSVLNSSVKDTLDDYATESKILTDNTSCMLTKLLVDTKQTHLQERSDEVQPEEIDHFLIEDLKPTSDALKEFENAVGLFNNNPDLITDIDLKNLETHNNKPSDALEVLEEELGDAISLLESISQDPSVLPDEIVTGTLEEVQTALMDFKEDLNRTGRENPSHMQNAISFLELLSDDVSPLTDELKTNVNNALDICRKIQEPNLSGDELASEDSKCSNHLLLQAEKAAKSTFLTLQQTRNLVNSALEGSELVAALQELEINIKKIDNLKDSALESVGLLEIKLSNIEEKIANPPLKDEDQKELEDKKTTLSIQLESAKKHLSQTVYDFNAILHLYENTVKIGTSNALRSKGSSLDLTHIFN